MISVQRMPLGDIDISSNIIVNVEGDAGGGSVTLEETLTKTSKNAVTSRGIWNKLATLSNEISTAAHTLDIQMGNEIVALATKPVSGGKIYAYLKDLSGQILENAYAADPMIPPIDDYVSKTSPNAVKSSGIYIALSAISSEIPTDYVKIGLNAENFISSENTFEGSPVYFSSKDTNGPLISFNTSKHSHFTADGCQFVIPTKSDGIGPGGNITDSQIAKRINASTSADIIATREWTQNKLDNLPAQEVDTTYLIDKRYGGEVSGDLGLYQHDFYNLSGNYVQSNSGNKVLNISDRNTFLQAESETRYGPAYTGTYGFCITELIDDYTIRLSGDISQLYDFFYNKQISDYPEVATNNRALSTWVFGNDMSSLKNALFSISLGDFSGSMRLKIAEVNKEESTVRFATNDLKIINIIKESGRFYKDGHPFTRDDFIDLYYNDDNAFYCVGFPYLGNLKIKNFYGQHAEGGSIRAAQKYTHAEGRDNIADVRYAHVEGSHNAAGDMAAHAEGFRTFAAKRFSHAEGQATKALADHSHVAGIGATATKSFSWVWNGKSNGTVDFDQYVQPDDSGNGAFCINPQKGINGFYIGLSSLGSILNNYQPSGGGSGGSSSGATFVPDSYKSFDTHSLIDQIYNNGNSFENSPTVHAFIKSGDNKWAFVNDNTSMFFGKIINVNPGDVITYVKKPRISTANFYTTYIRALSSFDAANIVNEQLAPVDTSISNTTLNDQSVISCWNGKAYSHQFYPQNSIFANNAHTDYSDDWKGANADKMWYNARRYFSHELLGQNPNDQGIYPQELFNCQAEISVKVPANTQYLYVCTRYYGTLQDFESFKINGYELISDKGKEKSTTINAFNVNSDLNVRRHSLMYHEKVGYYYFSNSNYMVTHPIKCKTGDRILISTKPYDRGVDATNARYIYVRSIEYLDKNFNRLSCNSAGNINNGFNANEMMSYHQNHDDYRRTLQLVDSGTVQVENCEYVKIGIVDPSLATVNNNEPMIQIVHSEDYPKYTVKEHQYYVPFVKDYCPQITDIPLIPKLVGKKLVFFGDSLTRDNMTGTVFPNKGKDSINIENSCDWSFTKGYVQFVSEALRCDYVNAGNGGDTAALSSHDGTIVRHSLANRLEKWDTDGFTASISADIPKADAAFVMIGTNDWAYSWTEFGDVDENDKTTDNFCGSIRLIIDDLSQITNRRCPIVFCTPIKRVQQNNLIDYGRPNSLGKTLEDYCNAIKSICSKNQNAYCIDLYNICKIDPLNAEIKDKYIPDGTHPDSLGHEVIAKGILLKLPEIMKKFYKETSPVDSMVDVANTPIANALVSAGISSNTPIEALTLGDVLTMTHGLQTTLS